MWKNLGLSNRGLRVSANVVRPPVEDTKLTTEEHGQLGCLQNSLGAGAESVCKRPRTTPHDSASWKLELPLELRQIGASAGSGQIDDYLGSAADPFFALLEEHRGFGPD